MSGSSTGNGETPEHIPHPKRKYERREPRKLKDVDSTIGMRKAQALAWSLPGGIAGALGTSFAGIGPIPGLIVGYLATYGMIRGISEGSGKAAGQIYHPTGKTAPDKHEYSYAESLAARGRYDEAVTAYEVGVSEFPEDPEPYIRIARMKRDKLREYEDAVFWFKRVRNDSKISPGQELLVTQELIEIYRDRLRTPTRAIPELARLIDRYPDDPIVEWARSELARLKEQVAAEERERAGG